MTGIVSLPHWTLCWQDFCYAMGALSKQIWSGTAPIAKDCLTVLTNSFQQLPVSSCREMLLEQAGSRQVEYKRVAQGEVGIAAATLTHVMCELLPTSCHESSVLLMDENVVAATSLVDAVLEAAPPYLRDDLFGEFPRMLQPSPLCLVAGGRGARSDLHIDPLPLVARRYVFSWVQLLPGRIRGRISGRIREIQEAPNSIAFLGPFEVVDRLELFARREKGLAILPRHAAEYRSVSASGPALWHRWLVQR